MSRALTAEIGDIVRRVVGDAFRDSPAAARNVMLPDAEAVALQAALAIEPALQHATNAEPWYRSRVTWGALVSLATPVLALAGWELAAEDRDAIVSAIVALGPAIGAALTLYGRWGASRPIGT